jgi:NTP pyrophosphatase (non-canonical NTP hydrolase)
MGYPSYDLTLNQYAERAMATAVYTDIVPDRLSYACLGLVEEAGEVAGKRKKQLRDGDKGPSRADMIKELGDVLWYAAAVARELDVSLEDVAQANLSKLASRAEKGTIHGQGDDR